MRQTNGILRKVSAYFAQAELDRPFRDDAFIDDHRDAYGVAPVCRVLPIASSTYYKHTARRQDTSRLSARAREDPVLEPGIARVFVENIAVYGVRKIW